MDATLDMAKVTTKGQITIPKAIRELLGVRTGDKVLFYDMGEGVVAMKSARVDAFRELQRTFDGAAKEAGIDDVDDVVGLVNDIRRDGQGL